MREEGVPHPGTGSYQTGHSPTHSTRWFEMTTLIVQPCTGERQQERVTQAYIHSDIQVCTCACLCTKNLQGLLIDRVQCLLLNFGLSLGPLTLVR